MKKIIASMTILCMLTLFITPTLAKDQDNNQEDYSNFVEPTIEQIETKKMFDMQAEITKTLEVSGNHYVYDKAKIENIVSSYDIDNFNAIFGTHHTVDSMTKSFIDKISSFEVKPQAYATTEGYTCNLSKLYYEWNYTRQYRTNNETNSVIRDTNNTIGSDFIAGLITGIAGLGHPILLVGAPALIGWGRDHAAALAAVNVSGCGTVVDYNTVTVGLLYYEANQKTFPGHF